MLKLDQPPDRAIGEHRTSNVVAIPGSLRRGSYNRALVEAAVQLAPADMQIATFDGLASIPHFNEDLEDPRDVPDGVVALREAVAASDGVLIVTPEYNHAIPGVLKNALDWLSRSRPSESLTWKPVATAGASTGPWGTRLAQASLRQILGAMGAALLPQPSLFVREAATVFDAEGTLVDRRVRAQLENQLVAFRDWIAALSRVGVAS